MVTTKATAEELGSGDLKRLLISYSGPAIAAMMASSLYNVIDRIFIGQGVSALAISGLAITMPVMNLSAAFGAMIGANEFVCCIWCDDWCRRCYADLHQNGARRL